MKGFRCPHCDGVIEPATAAAVLAHRDACPDWTEPEPQWMTTNDMLAALGSRFRVDEP